MTAFPGNLRLLELGPERLADIIDLDRWAFPSSDGLEETLALPSPLSWERAFGVVEADADDRLVAMHASYPFRTCPVPGGRLPVAGLTWVAVHPEARRRGILRSMIGAHFEHCRAWGEPISILTASEPAIYGRFGYGLAARQVAVTLPRGAALRPVAGAESLTVRIEHLEIKRHRELIGRLHGAVTRPGWVSRETPELTAAWFADSPMYHPGFESARILIAERAGVPVGYAVFRRNSSWGPGGPTGTVRVSDLVGTDPAVTHLLWSRLLDLDLTTEVVVGMLATDDPLLSLLEDVRAAVPTVKDNLWVRLVDVPAALAGRQYAADLDVVLEVSDAMLPANAGRWRLTASAFGSAVVTQTEAEPDLALDVRELGSAYLGGLSLAELAAAGLVTELTPGRLAAASAAFGWTQAPVANWVF